MADEIQLTFVVPGTPDAALQQWKQDRPAAFSEYEVADESYNSLTFQYEYYDWIWKLMWFLTFGVAWLLRGLGQQSVYRATARFDAEGGTRTKITILGKAPEQTRAELAELAAQNGGPVGLQVGV